MARPVRRIAMAGPENRCTSRLLAPLLVLEQHLQTRSYLAAERFTVADICVASVLAWVQGATGLLAQCPRVAEWLSRCLARPAFKTVRELAKSE